MATDRSDDVAAPEFWERFYGDRPQVWSGRVNAVVEHEAAQLVPGTALDVGCGEGGDAMWLAQQGWQVTAVDVSATALERGAAHAESAGLADRIHWERHDLAHSFPHGEFDLVSAQFLQSPIDLPTTEILQKAVHAVARRGALLIVGHAAPPASDFDPDSTVRFPTPEEVLRSLELPAGQWSVLRCETVDRDAHGPDARGGPHGPHAQSGTPADGIVMARRAAVRLGDNG